MPPDLGNRHGRARRERLQLAAGTDDKVLNNGPGENALPFA
jgi:hypothetical protein